MTNYTYIFILGQQKNKILNESISFNIESDRQEQIDIEIFWVGGEMKLYDTKD